MITDEQTNFLYLADTLPEMYPTFFKRFENILQASNVEFNFLPDTKDVWAVDYMPLQIEADKFVRFLYQPPYLTKSKKSVKTISDVDKICNHIGIETTRTNIILDGGNIVRSNNKVIMTDRIFIDNPKLEFESWIRLVGYYQSYNK